MGKLEQMIDEWDDALSDLVSSDVIDTSAPVEPSATYLACLNQAKLLARTSFDEYEGNLPGSYLHQLANWLEQFGEDDRKIAFLASCSIFFISRAQMRVLQRHVYERHIKKMILDEILQTHSFPRHKHYLALPYYPEALEHCFFAPLTDSADLRTFMHVNASDLKRPASSKLSGATIEMLVQPGKMLDKEKKRIHNVISDLEDQLRDLADGQAELALKLQSQITHARLELDQASTASQIFRNWLTARELKNKTHLFILEDFAGSGQTAATDIQRLAIDYPSLKRIVFCPCVCTAQARETILGVRANLPTEIEIDISVLPGIEIPANARAFSDDCYLWQQHTFPKTQSHIPEKLRRICDVAYSTYHHVENSPYANESDPIRITSGGYRDSQLLVVLYSNCPNNSLPIIWSTAKGTSREWQPLFERYPRY